MTKRGKNDVKMDRKLSPIMEAFSANESILRKYLRRFTSNLNDIDDITQETILRALRAEETKIITEHKGFIFGIARNVVRKGFERKSKSLIDYIDDYGDDEHVAIIPAAEDCLDSRGRLALFGEAVATLPSQCQKVFVLKKVYGYSHGEISKELGISISTTEKHVAAGLKRCLEFMDKRTKSQNTDSTISNINQRRAK